YDYHIPSGRIEWRGAIRDVAGDAPEEFTRLDVHGWIARVHPDDRQRTLDALQRAEQSLARFECEYRFRRNDGSYVRMLDRGVFIAGDDGRAQRLLGKMSD